MCDKPQLSAVITASSLDRLLKWRNKWQYQHARVLAAQKHCEVGEGYVYREEISLRKVLRVVQTPSNLCCIGQGLPGSLPWGVVLTYFNDYLVQEQRLNESIAASVCLGIFATLHGSAAAHAVNTLATSVTAFAMSACQTTQTQKRLCLIALHEMV